MWLKKYFRGFRWEILHNGVVGFGHILQIVLHILISLVVQFTFFHTLDLANLCKGCNQQAAMKITHREHVRMRLRSQSKEMNGSI